MLLLVPPLLRADERIRIERDVSEAEAVLRIVARHATHAPVDRSEWQGLFSTEPYIRLKRREAAFKAPFGDADFQAFVLSPGLSAQAAALGRTLDEWTKADLQAAAVRVLGYLPEEARIRVRVFVVIKPRTNSFVFEAETDPAIFLSLKPGVSEGKFENTVAHEMHHIGLSSLPPPSPGPGRDPGVQKALEWLGAFGEGLAMLAAAGDPGVHPHAHSAPADRARWDADMARFPTDLARIDRFLVDLARGRLVGEGAEREGAALFGEQGPWYTVGYGMAVAIETRYGRPALLECMRHMETFVPRYNQAAAEAEPPLPLYSAELVRSLAPGPP